MRNALGFAATSPILRSRFAGVSNIPARYVNGYLGDIGVPADPAPMDFSAWFEAFLDGKWHAFDARHNIPRIGRVVIARGRDATDVPLLHTFGPHRLNLFKVWTYEEQASRRCSSRCSNSAWIEP